MAMTAMIPFRVAMVMTVFMAVSGRIRSLVGQATIICATMMAIPSLLAAQDSTRPPFGAALSVSLRTFLPVLARLIVHFPASKGC